MSDSPFPHIFEILSKFAVAELPGSQCNVCNPPFLKSVRNALEERGHKSMVKKDWDPWFGAVQTVLIDPETGAILGGADPRRDGAAAGFSGEKAIFGRPENKK